MPADLTKRLTELFRWNDPGPHSSHLVSELSGWWHDATLLAEIGPALADLFRAEKPTIVVAPEVTGYLLGPLVAVALKAGFVPAIKRGGDRWIAEPITWARTQPDYRGRILTLGIRSRHITASDRVLIVDDWVTTGAQIRALREVARSLGAVVVGCATVVADCPVDLGTELGVRALVDSADLA